MNVSLYLFDFKNITNPTGIQDCLKDWQIEKLSDRAFKVSGREYAKTDLVKLYQFIGNDGHIFVFDFQNQHEFYYQKHQKGRKRETAKDSDLDCQTVRCISDFLAN